MHTFIITIVSYLKSKHSFIPKISNEVECLAMKEVAQFIVNSVSKVWRQTDADFKIRRMRTGKGTSIVNKTGGNRVV